MKITEIKYFSPDGRNKMPDGVYFQKGGFVHECEVNAHKFKVPDSFLSTAKEGVASGGEEIRNLIFDGVVVVLPNNVEFGGNLIFDWVKKHVNPRDEIRFSTGNFFYGKYTDSFDKNSVVLEIKGMKWESLLTLVEKFLNRFRIDKAIIKNLKDGKIFLVTR